MPKSFSVVLFALAAAPTLASPGLTQTQILRLKKLGEIVIPSYVPIGFKLCRVRTERNGFMLEYAGPHGADLRVQMANQDTDYIVVGDDTFDGKTRMTTRVVNGYVGKGSMIVATRGKHEEFAVDWVALGETASPRFLRIFGWNLAANVGVKVWKGLRYLK